MKEPSQELNLPAGGDIIRIKALVRSMLMLLEKAVHTSIRGDSSIYLHAFGTRNCASVLAELAELTIRLEQAGSEAPPPVREAALPAQDMSIIQAFLQRRREAQAAQKTAEDNTP